MGWSCNTDGPPDLARLSLDGVFEQCYALRPDRLGAGLCYLWLRFDYQRKDTPFAVLVAHFATDDEALTLPKVAGVILAFAGVALLVGPDAFAGMSFYLGA